MNQEIGKQKTKAMIAAEIQKTNSMNVIITKHIYPPVPVRDWDWEAAREDYDQGDLIGYGKTEQEAINNLLELEKAEQETYKNQKP